MPAHFHSGVKAKITTNDVLALFSHRNSLPTKCQVLLLLGMNWGEKSQLAMTLNIKELEDWEEGRMEKKVCNELCRMLELRGKGEG